MFSFLPSVSHQQSDFPISTSRNKLSSRSCLLFLISNRIFSSHVSKPVSVSRSSQLIPPEVGFFVMTRLGTHLCVILLSSSLFSFQYISHVSPSWNFNAWLNAVVFLPIPKHSQYRPETARVCPLCFRDWRVGFAMPGGCGCDRMLAAFSS